MSMLNLSEDSKGVSLRNPKKSLRVSTKDKLKLKDLIRLKHIKRK